MISVDDLVKWAKLKATGKSTTHIHGWIKSKDLLALAIDVLDNEPLDYGSVGENMSTLRIELLEHLNTYKDQIKE